MLACQVDLDMSSAEFCARFGWSREKFHTVAQRARARLKTLVADYDAGERCRAMHDDLLAVMSKTASTEQSSRVRVHLANCPACARMLREAEIAARGVAALLPLPA